MVQCLPSKEAQALGSNPNTTKQTSKKPKLTI
jgi:hypothetical protein